MKSYIRFTVLTIFGLVLVLTLYIAYNLYLVEDIYIKKTRGSHFGISIDSPKNVVIKYLKKYVTLNKDYFFEIDLYKENNVNKVSIDELLKYGSSEFLNVDTLVLYLCNTSCDWRRENHWVSFVFRNDKLDMVSEFEKKKWELP